MLPGALFISILLTLFIQNETLMNTRTDPQDNISPDRVSSWETSESKTYTRDNLFEYINGGAELYISFGFSKVYSRVYTAENQPGIILDIFKMNSARDAYGVFTFSSETTNADIGQGAYLDNGVILFWKDHYYVSIMSYPETSESREAIIELALAVDGNIKTTGSLPGVLDYLPVEGLDSNSIRFFHHPAWINTHYYISDENIFVIDSQSDCVLARYGDRDNRMVLLLIEYHDPEVARAGYDFFRKDYLPELEESEVVKLEDGTYTGCRLTGNFLVAGFNGRQEEELAALMNSAIDLFKDHS